ncbi:ComEA family DNA-binding protein [Aquimarina brevivitae]|uniref:DNA uptake protein ComE-like DNA-binding protein n=1 Tax=Aquimarina brevivitae TaxID=323412 RepID=A0A4Q7NZZ2_9FLAO|nr:helix-hairpin-helix domain-containing protein [Aquimarina brevivitae]RZS93083.1 DNA uptake protein ComE-like DNA-binding protein [Aquimarina brevivitae]
MKTFKSHFEIHPRFQNGIFVLAILLIVFLSALGYFSVSSSTEKPLELQELVVYQTKIDSLKKAAHQEKLAYAMKPFNPNFITDYKGYVLGLSVAQIDKLQEYRAQNKWINSKEDFARVTGVTGAQLDSIAQYFKFPEWVSQKSTSLSNRSKNVAPIAVGTKKDLNTVTRDELITQMNVPDFIADRIISYRNKIGGFLSDAQLLDIKGLYDGTRRGILKYYTVKMNTPFSKIAINTATVKDLMKVPYFNFELALDIHDHIVEQGGISNFEELRKIQGFPVEKIDRIALYLTIK